ncbi:MAG: tRNA (guanosine(46)-N7)-methyltransferase TrmB [Treponema sp.]|jgi:tRNA (guanine-N7-)-methyltransferase|nr:tRNA (guanosine(46)-N7)-methyltransferase TrmB [Treponema sp.]
MTEAQARNYEELSQFWCVPFTGQMLNFATLFGNENPLVIEIGFGMGQATSAIAAANPGVNYLGIEVYRNGIGRLLGDIRQMGLTNLRIIEHDALEVLAAMIPDGAVEGFHLFFSDPWPKKKHHKRRLVQRPRTHLFSSKLRDQGYLSFVTDWEPYALFAREELDATAGLVNQYESFAPPQTWRPETKFEKKGRAGSRAIFELLYRKK